MRILKFGGTSVGTPERVRGVAEIVARAHAQGEIAVVVSAFGGVTDALLGAAETARRGGAWPEAWDQIRARHRRAADQLGSEAERAALLDDVEQTCGDLRDLLHGIALVREASPRVLDAVASHGERLSAPLVAAALRTAGVDAEACDARRLIVTGAPFGAGRVDQETTRERVRHHFEVTRPVQVVTGFVASTLDGETTTLGRGGSDFTAALLGAALQCEAVEIWTDVDGVMSADPRVVPEAVPLEVLSYDELMELSHFGAKVVHPPSVHPTRAAGVPLLIRNTLRPEAPGTLIAPGPGGERTVCGVSSIAPVALLRLEGDGMVGVPGIAMRLFGALARRGINVILISQASSEHSLCFAIEPGAVPAARESIGEEFALELDAGLVDPLIVENEQAVIAAVGNGMRERPGLAGQLFGMLGARGVNVRAIAQGSSERNVSVVVAARQRATAVRAIHGAFFGDPARLELGLLGVGRVGGALLEQLASARRVLEGRGVKVAIVGVASSRRLALSDAGLRPEDARAALDAGTGEGAAALVERLALSEAPLRVLVDATASDDVPELYARAAGSGVAVVTANKRLPAGPLDGWRRLTGPGRRLYCETTVGAGIPVLRALRDLIETGDQVISIEGLVSGTLGYVLDAVAGGRPLSHAVRDAWERGYTEPHPGEDLSGTDVARKALILAREAGLELEPADVAHEPLLPGPDWAALGMDEFWTRLAERDGELAEHQAKAAREGGRLCYLALIEEGRVTVRLRAVGPDHPCASARGTENVIAIRSTRYCDLPLTLRGPGAGPDVTAAGLLADVLRAAVETPRGRWPSPGNRPPEREREE